MEWAREIWIMHPVNSNHSKFWFYIITVQSTTKICVCLCVWKARKNVTILQTPYDSHFVESKWMRIQFYTFYNEYCTCVHWRNLTLKFNAGILFTHPSIVRSHNTEICLTKRSSSHAVYVNMNLNLLYTNQANVCAYKCEFMR